MNPYRGALLATAMLLAMLPLSGCGDADKYAESGDIKLTSDVSSVAANHQVNYTVESTPTPPAPTASIAPTIPTKVIIPECEMALEYESKGGNISQGWTPIPGTGATRMFSLRPRETSPLSVLARGKCIGSKEEWKYSNQVIVTVNDPAIPTITLTADPTSVVKNNPVTFTLGATAEGECDIQLSYEYSGAGFVGVKRVNPAYFGQFILKPTAEGNLTVTATSWCSQRPAGVGQTSISVTVTAAEPEVLTITNPDPVTGPNSVVHDAWPGGLYQSGGASCSSGSVQYQFTATGNPTGGSPTAWSYGDSTYFSWPAPVAPATSYPVSVTVQARCADDTSVLSAVSAALSVTVNN